MAAAAAGQTCVILDDLRSAQADSAYSRTLRTSPRGYRLNRSDRTRRATNLRVGLGATFASTRSTRSRWIQAKRSCRNGAR